jgi:hypothetical protein
VSELNENTKGPVRDVALGVACDGLKGEIESEEDLYNSLSQQFYDLTRDELELLVSHTIELWSVMYNAYAYGDDWDKAAVSLACWSLERAG